MANIFYRALQNIQRKMVDLGDGTHAPEVIAHPPANLQTGTTNPRMRVDVAETSLFEKREFETFREFSAVTTGTYLLRVVSPVNFIIQNIAFDIEAGSVRLSTFMGGEPTGTFSEALPYLPTNNMTEGPDAYTGQLVIDAIPSGGSLTGGTLARVGRLKTSGNSTFSSTVGGKALFVVARPPGTYFIKLELVDAIGVLYGRVEERP